MKWLHNLMKGASLTGALFVFQACYGVPQPALTDEAGSAPMSFSLVSKQTGEPIEGVRITGNATGGVESFKELGVTGADGKCRVSLPYVRNLEGPFVRFEDPEGLYAAVDTSFADLREREIVIRLDRLP